MEPLVEKLLWSLGGSVVTGVLAILTLRHRARVSWEESATGHLAKLRHEALAKCLSGVGQLCELDYMPRSSDEEQAAYIARTAEPLRLVAAHDFMLPPDLRREVEKVLRWVRPGGPSVDSGADALCQALDRYLPPIARPSLTQRAARTLRRGLGWLRSLRPQRRIAAAPAGAGVRTPPAAG